MDEVCGEECDVGGQDAVTGEGSGTTTDVVADNGMGVVTGGDVVTDEDWDMVVANDRQVVMFGLHGRETVADEDAVAGWDVAVWM